MTTITHRLSIKLLAVFVLPGIAAATRAQAQADSSDQFPIKLYVRILKLDAKDIAYDAATEQLYASVGPNVTGRANSITSIDPVTGTLGLSVFVGSDPGRIAIAPNGGTLYVMLEGAKALCRFNTALKSVEQQFPANTNIEDMIVPAGHPNWVATANYNPGLSPRHGGGTLYVSGKPIGLYQWGPNVFISTPDGDNLYGLYNELGASGIGRRGISPSGPGTPKGFIDDAHESSSDIKYEGGKLFASSGKIFDFENPSILGTCTGGSGLVAPQAKAHRVYFLQNMDKGWRFHAFDTRTFTSLGTMDIPGLQGNPMRLVKWGDDSYAVRTSSSQIIFISPVPDLFALAQGEDSKTLRKLLAKGANPNAEDAVGRTPLIMAAEAGNADGCRALLEKGADPLMQDFAGNTALMAAAAKGQTAILPILYDRHADVNAKRTDGSTALLLAVLGGSIDTIKSLLDHGADVNARTAGKRTMLMSAILAHKTAAARMLISRKADVKAQTDTGDTALKFATVSGITELIPILRQAGAK